MWVRQCEIDAADDGRPPLPAVIASNEEFVPPRQSERQREYLARYRSIADDAARQHRIPHRDYARSPAGMAAALLALNAAHGPTYDVEPVEAIEPGAFEEKWPKEQFIFDVQTHHVDVARDWYDRTEAGRKIKAFFEALRPDVMTSDGPIEPLNRAHYVKEVFGDSDTVLAIISGVPTRDWESNPLPPHRMVETRRFVNEIAGSRRVLSHGLLRPNLGPRELDEMRRQAEDLRIDSWKMYTGAEVGERAWRLDDEAIAYPFWEESLKLGIKNICVHKGLPLSTFNEQGCRPDDAIKAARDWPDLNFILYHSAYRGLPGTWTSRGTGEPVVDAPTDDPGDIPWTSDILRDLDADPSITNVYFELGGTFHMTSLYAPEVCMHLLGRMLQVVGPDRILWGTDSIWNGSPQGQIERMRRLQIRPELIDRYGYPQLTDAIKAQME
jgi:predicted TIM-barrel fold metal-dependent hydrolase